MSRAFTKVLQSQKEENWSLPIMFAVIMDLRRFASSVSIFIFFHKGGRYQMKYDFMSIQCSVALLDTGILWLMFNEVLIKYKYILKADIQLRKKGRGKEGETLEKAADLIMGCFRVCASDK